MIIERSTQQSILPEAVESLQAATVVKTYHNEYGYRPPLGIYNVAFDKVLNCFVEVLDALEAIMDEQPFRKEEKRNTGFDAKLQNAQENLLKSINELFDGQMSILQCFYPPPQVARDKLSKKEPIVGQYWQSIKDLFAMPVKNIVNNLKHENRRLRFFALFNNELAIPGYFLESIDKNGRILPDRKIHIPVRSIFGSDFGYDTAFSFSRDLRYLFWGIYFVGHHLANAIYGITGIKPPVKQLEQGAHDQKVCEVVKRITALPLRFYSDELKKDLPTVQVISKEGVTDLKLTCPDNNTLLISGYGSHMGFSTIVSDGVTLTYKFPYSTGGEL